MSQEKQVSRYISIFFNSLKDIDALKQFYNSTSKNIMDLKSQIENNYRYGLELSKVFTEILNENTIDNRNAKINDVYERIIDNNIKIKDICKIKKFEKTDERSLSYSINAKYRNNSKYNPIIVMEKISNIKKNEHILVGSVLSNIIIIFESMLTAIYRLLIFESPQVYLKGKTISVASFFDRSVSNELENLIEDKIDSDIYNSLKTLNEIAEMENLQYERYEKFILEFKEIYFRRNSYVHTNGKANKKYLMYVDEKFTKNVKEDDSLVCDDIYINNAILVLTKLLFSIIYEIISKRNASTKQINIIANNFFERLQNKEYEITSSVYYALSQYKPLEFLDRAMYRINYINAIKQLGLTDKVKKELKNLDLSIATDDFKIAKECLLDNNDIVFKMLKNTYPNSYTAVHIKEWPIFVNFRETDYYKDFVALHQEDFAIEEIETEDQNEELNCIVD